MKYLALFLIIGLTVGITVGQQLLTFFGVNTNFFFIALIAIACAGLLAKRNLLLIILVVGISVAANLPVEMLDDYGLDRDILVGGLIVIVILPMFSIFERWF